MNIQFANNYNFPYVNYRYKYTFRLSIHAVDDINPALP